MKKEIEFGELFNYFPTPVVLVTSKDNDKENVVTLAWVGIVCSKPATVSISIRPHRFSNKIIKKSKEFVINIPGEKMLKKVDLAGTVSGKDIDKFRDVWFVKEFSKEADASRIAETGISIECKVKKVIKLGTHDMFIAEVKSISVDEDLLKDGKIDFSKLRPIVLLGREYWSLGNKIGEYGFSRK